MVAERLAAGQEINVSNPFVPHSFALQINALTSGWPVIRSEAPVCTLRCSARHMGKTAASTGMRGQDLISGLCVLQAGLPVATK
jgi:hypothetical protein